MAFSRMPIIHVSAPRSRQSVQVIAQTPILRRADGSSVKMEKPALLLGKDDAADVRLEGCNVTPEHARLEWKSGRLFCTALFPVDPDDLMSPTKSWIEDSEMLPGVAYMVAPGTCMSFGEWGANTIVAEFSESSADSSIANMLMKGMASQASSEVRSKLEGL